jgi:hypothetical protein
MYRFAFLSVCSVAVLACSSSSGSSGDAGAQATNAGNGVDDVEKACTLREAWTQSSSSQCIDCIQYAGVAPCSCSSDPYLGMCLTQSQAKAKEADCTAALATCVTDCLSDCSCVNACYSGHDACKTVAAALDGCLVAACGGVCK